MHLRAQLFQPLLVADAEMLLLVDDQEPEIPELDRFAEQRMGADHDVDIAVGEVLFHLRELFRRDQARGLRDIDRKAAKPFGEIPAVLAREQRRRHHDGDLLAVECDGERRPQRHLGLAEPDVAADQPVHRPAAFEVLQRGIDRAELVLGLLIGEARAEFVIGMRLHRHFRRFMQMPLGGDLDQLAGDFPDPLLQLGLARLPAAAAKSVELDMGVVGAVARQQLDIFDRQEQLGLGGVMQLETIVRRTGDVERLQTDKAADAVLDMDHEIAGGKARDLRDEIVELAARPARPHQPVAENVLLADDGDLVSLEAGLHADHGQHGFVAWRRLHGAPGVDAGQVEQLVIPQHAAHAVARAFAPQRDHHLLALGLQRADMRDHRFEHVDGAIGALRREIASLPRAGIDHVVAALGNRKRRQPCQRGLIQPFGPFVLGQIEPIRRQRLVDRAAAGMAPSPRAAPRNNPRSA